MYTRFHLTSLKADTNIFSWREFINQGKSINVKSIISLAIHYEMIPSLFSIKHLINHIISIIPPKTVNEFQFFENNEVENTFNILSQRGSLIYDEDESDPRVSFHEFTLMISRFAIHYVKTKNKIEDRVQYFLVSKLGFPMIYTLQTSFKYDEYLQEEMERREISSSDEDEYLNDDEEEDSESESDREEDWITGEDGIRYPKKFGAYGNDITDIMDNLGEILPDIPDKTKVEQENPPPYKEPIRVEFGSLLVKPEPKGKKGKKKDAKAKPSSPTKGAKDKGDKKKGGKKKKGKKGKKGKKAKGTGDWHKLFAHPLHLHKPIE